MKVLTAFFIFLNFITLLVIFLMRGTEFADLYHIYVSIIYWSTLVMGCILLSKKDKDVGLIFVAYSIVILVGMAIAT